MRDGFIKVSAVTPKVRVADPEYNCGEILARLEEEWKKKTKICVFPELCLTAYTCNDLFLQKALLDGAKEELKTIRSTSIILPDLKGLNYSSAIGVLGKYGLKYELSPKADGSTDFKIVDQYPAAGTSVAKGDMVYLYRE